MGRITKEYVCTCDRCGRDIKYTKYENEVKFNSCLYIFCERCYQDLLGFLDLWKNANLNNTIKTTDETN